MSTPAKYPQFVTFREVFEVLRFPRMCRASFYSRVREGTFPRGIPLIPGMARPVVFPSEFFLGLMEDMQARSHAANGKHSAGAAAPKK